MSTAITSIVDSHSQRNDGVHITERKYVFIILSLKVFGIYYLKRVVMTVGHQNKFPMKMKCVVELTNFMK